MECPRCGLINPEIAQRCDCGYDFEKGTVEKPYYKQEFPKDIKIWAILSVVELMLVAAASLAVRDLGSFIGALIWAAVVFGLYRQLVQKKNWARIVLIVLTFPMGVILGLSREAKLYCLQTKE